MIRLRTALLLVTLTSSVLAAGQHATPPSQTPARFHRAGAGSPDTPHALLQRYVDDGRIAGAVALVLRDGKTVYDRAVGWSDKEGSRRMAPDTIFRIASQSKALTSVAALSLMEEGKLALSSPVSEFIPAFAKTTVSAATGGRSRPDGPLPFAIC